MQTGNDIWAAVAPFLVGLAGFTAIFQGAAKAVRPAGANKKDIYGKWLDAFASMIGGVVMVAVFGAWAWSQGIRPTTTWAVIALLLACLMAFGVWFLGHMVFSRQGDSGEGE